MQEQIRIKKKNTRSPINDSELSKKRNDHSHPLLKIQKTVGNQATVQLREGLGILQTKLNIGQPNDIYEQEADTVASRIVNQISRNGVNTRSQSQKQPVHMIQRQDKEYAQPRLSEQIQRQPLEEEEEMLQTRQLETVQRQEEEEEFAQTRLSEQIQRQPMEEEEEMLQPRQLGTVQRQEEEEMQFRQSEQIQRQDEEEMLELKPSDDIQRQEEEEYEEDVQTKSSSDSQNSGALTSSLESQVQREQLGGEELDSSTRAQMESGFGYDFSQVHIHNNTTSDQIARQINAEAFTLKGDIFFRNGRYNPTSTQGQDLLAHELTHVVQQGAAPNPDTQSPGPL